MNTLNRLATAVLRSPVLWGLLATLGFYALVHTGTLQGEFFSRYFTSHWVEYVTTAMFFVAMAHLLLKGCDLADQRARLKQPLFDAVVPVPRAVDEAQILLGELSQAPAADAQSYLPRRLREALESVLRSGSADQLDEELKYLSELDTGRAQSSGALVRIIIWAIPMLGFLGTVIGMTLAISELSATEMENSLPHVIGGLGVAFDSTTLALSLSITLMFVQFFVDRLERGLLAEVDVRAGNELLHRFQRTGSERDPHIAAFRRLAEDVVHATERLVGRQAELWQSTIADAQQQWQSSVEDAHERWNQLTSQNQLQLETALASAMLKGVEAHTHRLVAAEEAVAAENRRHWASVQQQMVTAAEAFGQRVIDAEHTLAAENRVLLDRLQSTFVGGMERTQLALRDSVERVQQALDVTAETARGQQLELSKQTDILLQVVDATGQITRLEDALNRNLAALGGAQHLQETLLNLSAAINLLNARLGNVAPGSPQVGLRKSPSVEKAA